MAKQSGLIDTAAISATPRAAPQEKTVPAVNTIIGCQPRKQHTASPTSVGGGKWSRKTKEEVASELDAIFHQARLGNGRQRRTTGQARRVQDTAALPPFTHDYDTPAQIEYFSQSMEACQNSIYGKWGDISSAFVGLGFSLVIYDIVSDMNALADVVFKVYASGSEKDSLDELFRIYQEQRVTGCEGLTDAQLIAFGQVTRDCFEAFRLVELLYSDYEFAGPEVSLTLW